MCSNKTKSMKICVTKFNQDAWTVHAHDLFTKALKKSNIFKVVDSLNGYPDKNNFYDIIIVCGVRSLFKDKVDLIRLKKHAGYICDMSDFDQDKRSTIEDLTFYFVPSKALTNKFKFLPKPIDDNFLFPNHEKNEPMTIFIDHFGATNNGEIKVSKDALQKVFDEIKLCPFPLRVFYQHSTGIIENPIEPEYPTSGRKLDIKFLPFQEISEYYRKTHIFFPTHLESQGMLAQEIGLCGGLTVMQSWMYPQQSHNQFSKVIYSFNDKINWEALRNFITPKQIEKNRKIVLYHCNFEKFKLALIDHIVEIF